MADARTARIAAEIAEITGAISRRGGGYQTRSSARDEWIEVKGGKLKGWLRLTISEARERFNIPAAPRQEAP